MKGTLVLWSSVKGYGFVQPDATTEESDRFFIHITNFANKESVRLGVRIEFSIGDPISIGKKPQAVHAKVLPEILPVVPIIGVDVLKAGL